MGHPVEGTQLKCELLPYLELSQHVDHQRETQSQGGNAGNCHGDVVVLEEHLHGISLFLFCMLLGQVATFLPHPKLILHGNNLQLPLTWFRHFFGSWWAATVATYCPGRMAEHPEPTSTGGCYHAERSPCSSREVDLAHDKCMEASRVSKRGI